MSPERLKLFVANRWLESKTDSWTPVYNPSTGEVQAETPNCLASEVEDAVEEAATSFPAWAETPPPERAKFLFSFRDTLIKQKEKLASIISRENGKTIAEAVGSVARGIEIVEFACGIPAHLAGESVCNLSSGLDFTTLRQPMGVCVGIFPFNFPAMVPLWMFPIAIACGNTVILKANERCPLSCAYMMNLLVDAGLPPGVVNMVLGGKETVDTLIRHPKVMAVSFVGSTRVGRIIYETAAANGKRVQALCQAKNHALVLPDCSLEQTARGIVNAAFGCTGERCMALPVAVVHEAIAKTLVEKILQEAQKIRVGPAEDAATVMGPLVTPEHLERVRGYIDKGISEGAKLILDGRSCKVTGFPKGFYLGPTIFDHVTNEMVVGREEIFGPVLCIKRVKSFEEGIKVINQSPYGNGSAIFTGSGHYAREFVCHILTGMVGVNVGIPVPLGFFSFTGWKESFFGDLHSHGRDGVIFYTRKKSISSRWFKPEEGAADKLGAWG